MVSCEVIIILDGCNIKTLKRAETPNVEKISSQGLASFSTKSVFPSLTFTCHASILTGSYPFKHGIVGNTFYEKLSKCIINFDQYDVNKYLMTTTIFEDIKKKSAAIGTPITRGATYIITKSEVQNRPLGSQNEYAIKLAEELIKENKPELLVINLPEIDTILETYGPSSKEAVRSIERADELLGYIESVIRENYDEYLFIIIADHGMIEVYENINLQKELKEFNVIVCASHRFAHLYFKNEKEIKKAYNMLKSDKRFSTILKKERTKRYNLYHKRTGDIIVSAARGYEFSEYRLKGSHGGLEYEEFKVPLIINRKEFKDLIKGSDITVIKKILLRFNREQNVISQVKSIAIKKEQSHGWEHILRVLNTSTKLALKYGGDIEVIRLSALLHDIVRDVEPHAELSAKYAEKLLNKLGIEAEKIRAVVKAIRNHQTKEPEALESIEEKILWDADKLDALGIIGLARCLQESGALHKTIDNAITHVVKDTIEFSKTMHFKESKKLADLKNRNLEIILRKLKEELNIKI